MSRKRVFRRKEIERKKSVQSLFIYSLMYGIIILVLVRIVLKEVEVNY
ncbi:MAG: hypothetical protein RBR46_01135 [Acholeplasmatales bacterium]|jgi:hypothetical protein|nr:hypothetical protein [Acholeplasmatales bacterium]